MSLSEELEVLVNPASDVWNKFVDEVAVPLFEFFNPLNFSTEKSIG